MATCNAVDSAKFSTSVRGYHRAAVDETIARELQRVRELQDRADRLERELAALRVAIGVPTRKQALRQAVEVVSQGWEDAARITLDAEYALGKERARAEGIAATFVAAAERHAADADRAARAQADRLIAATKQEAARLIAEAEAEQERAKAGAAALTAAAADRAKDIARGFTATLHSLEADVVAELTQRQKKAERDVETATGMLRRAEKDAEFVGDQAAAQRVAILAEARAQVSDIEQATGSQLSRVHQETDLAAAELAQLMVKAGGKLPGVKSAGLLPAPATSPENGPSARE